MQSHEQALADLLPEQVSRGEIVDLLQSSGDDVSAAANLYFDKPQKSADAAGKSHAAATMVAERTIPAKKRAETKESRGGGKSRRMEGQASIRSFLNASPNTKSAKRNAAHSKEAGGKEVLHPSDSCDSEVITIDDDVEQVEKKPIAIIEQVAKEPTRLAGIFVRSKPSRAPEEDTPAASSPDAHPPLAEASPPAPQQAARPPPSHPSSQPPNPSSTTSDSSSPATKRSLALSSFGSSSSSSHTAIAADEAAAAAAAAAGQQGRLLSDDYDPISDACWKAGEAAPYLHLSRALSLIEHEKGRLKTASVICNMFRSLLALSPEDVLPAARLVTGRLPLGVDLKVGGAAVSDAISECTGASRCRLGALYKELGDPGDVAQACRANQRVLVPPPPLRIGAVYTTLQEVAAQSGPGSAARRRRLITSLLRSCREQETRYIVRTLVQNMRIGMNTTLLLAALAAAVVRHTSGPATPRPADKSPAKGRGRAAAGKGKKAASAAAQKAAAAAAGDGGDGDGGESLSSRIKAAAAAAQRAYALCPSLETLVPALIDGGVDLMLERCRLTPGAPVKPMLAKVSTSVRDLLAQFTKRFPPPVAFLAEYKYDGQRALIHHLPDGQVKIFSRNCEDKTEAFPDVVDVIRAAAAAGAHAGKSFIVDAEIVAVVRPVGGSVTPTTSHTNEASESKETSTAVLKESTTTDAASGAKSDKVPVAASRGASAEGSAVAELELLPMQMLATRARGSVDAKGIKTAVCVFLFDLLCVGEHSAASDSLRQRRQLLRETLPDMVPGYIELARSVELRTDDVDVEEATQAFLLESLAGQCEGLVVKVLDGAVYEPGRRADSWMKLKKDYIDGMADSLDLVPIGAWYGNGRKAGWFSPWLMAAQDPDSGELQSVCRVMSGFTDVFYKEATERFKGRIIEAPRAYYVTGESPNVWFDAAEVWELRGAELTISPVHKAGVGLLSAEKGLSLRFPRFLRVRHDKQVEEATSGAQLAQLYRQQTRRQKPLSGGAAKEAAAQGRAAVGGCEAARTDDGGTGDSSTICDGDDDVRESDGEGSAGCDDDVAVGDVLADILGDSDDSDGDDAQ